MAWNYFTIAREYIFRKYPLNNLYWDKLLKSLYRLKGETRSIWALLCCVQILLLLIVWREIHDGTDMEEMELMTGCPKGFFSLVLSSSNFQWISFLISCRDKISFKRQGLRAGGLNWKWMKFLLHNPSEWTCAASRSYVPFQQEMDQELKRGLQRW